MTVAPIDGRDSFSDGPFMMAVEEITGCLAASVKPKKRRQIQASSWILLTGSIITDGRTV